MVKCLNHFSLQLVMPNSDLSRQLIFSVKRKAKADVCKISLFVNNSFSRLHLSRTAAPNFSLFYCTTTQD